MARAGIRCTVRDVDKGWRRLRTLFDNYARRGSYAKVGLLGSEAADDRGDLTQAEIGAVHEFGSEDGRIPRRSWIGSTFDEQQERLLIMARELIVAVVDGKATIEKALAILGFKLSTEIKKKVTTGEQIPPPNAPSTAERKIALTRGSPPPAAGAPKRDANGRFSRAPLHGIRTLVDTGRMIASVTYAVIVEGKS